MTQQKFWLIVHQRNETIIISPQNAYEEQNLAIIDQLNVKAMLCILCPSFLLINSWMHLALCNLLFLGFVFVVVVVCCCCLVWCRAASGETLCCMNATSFSLFLVGSGWAGGRAGGRTSVIGL